MPDEAPKKDRLAITIQGKFNQSRDVVFQTTMSLDLPEKEIYQEFSRICEIMDRREEFYLIKGLTITLERDTAQYKAEQEKVNHLREAYQNEWLASGRKGVYELRGQQKQNIDNLNGSLKALKDRIDKVKSELAELHELQKAYK